MEEVIGEIKKIIEEFISFFKINYFEVSVIEDEERIKINLKIDDAGFLIGKDGATLKELEKIIRTILFNKYNMEKRIFLDINNYQKNKEVRLKETAKDIAREVLINKSSKKISGLNGYERRIIHSELAHNPSIITKSIGEGEDRCLIVEIYS
jgi:spoIIIJ-associated protein